MKRQIKLDIISDDGIHCNSCEPKKFCPYLTSMKSGTIWGCSIFSEIGGKYIFSELEINPKNHRLIRHPDCIKSEIKESVSFAQARREKALRDKQYEKNKKLIDSNPDCVPYEF